MDQDDETEKWREDPEGSVLEWAKSQNYSKKTSETILWLFMKFVDFLEKNKISFENVNKTIFSQFINGLTKSVKSRRIYASQLNSLFSHLEDISLIQENPVDFQRISGKGRIEKKLPTYLTNEELTVFKKSIENPKTWRKARERAILFLLIHTGARCSEIANLTLDSVQIGEGGGSVRLYGKGRKERDVPLSDEATIAVEDFLAFREGPPGEFLFANKWGTPPTPATIYVMVQKTFAKAGIVKGKLGPHVLRHTFATRQFAAGTPPAIIKNWLGHASLSTTLIYEHVSGSMGGIRPV